MLDDHDRHQPADQPRAPRADGRLRLVPEPGLLAKITSKFDVVSGGRLDWGIGAGWYQHEYQAYGYHFPPARDRIALLRETVEIVQSLWSEPDTTFEGRLLHGQGRPVRPEAAAAARTRRSWSGAAASS